MRSTAGVQGMTEETQSVEMSVKDTFCRDECQRHSLSRRGSKTQSVEMRVKDTVCRDECQRQDARDGDKRRRRRHGRSVT